MPGTLRDDNEVTRTQCGGVLHLAVEKEDRGRAIDDHDDLVADGMALHSLCPPQWPTKIAPSRYAASLSNASAEPSSMPAGVWSGRNVSPSIAWLIESGTGRSSATFSTLWATAHPIDALATDPIRVLGANRHHAPESMMA